MPVDPAIQAVLDQLEALGGPKVSELDPPVARQMYAMTAALDGEPEDVAAVTNRTIPGPAGDVPVRVYRPAGASDGDRPPVIVYYHGGGYVIGDLETHDVTSRRIANRAGAVVVAVDYRLGPEHRCPAAVADGWAALEWVASNGAELQADASRIAVGGDSAGGGVAAGVAIRARDAGGPVIRHQLLVYPWVDLTCSQPSVDENAEGYFLTKDTLLWFAAHYLGTMDPKDPAASPLHATDVGGLAPATIVTTAYDPLRDEGEAYAERLQAAGVPVEVHRYDTMVHGFLNMGSVTPVTLEAIDAAAARLREALHLNSAGLT